MVRTPGEVEPGRPLVGQELRNRSCARCTRSATATGLSPARNATQGLLTPAAGGPLECSASRASFLLPHGNPTGYVLRIAGVRSFVCR